MHGSPFTSYHTSTSLPETRQLHGDSRTNARGCCTPFLGKRAGRSYLYTIPGKHRVQALLGWPDSSCNAHKSASFQRCWYQTVGVFVYQNLEKHPMTKKPSLRGGVHGVCSIIMQTTHCKNLHNIPRLCCCCRFAHKHIGKSQPLVTRTRHKNRAVRRKKKMLEINTAVSYHTHTPGAPHIEVTHHIPVAPVERALRRVAGKDGDFANYVQQPGFLALD